jgi:hypothetical protein
MSERETEIYQMQTGDYWLDVTKEQYERLSAGRHMRVVYAAPMGEEISDELLQALALKFLGDEYDDDLEGLREFARAITWR